VKKGYKLFASKMREDLYRNLKLLSAAEGKSIQTLLEEAVTDYLDKRRFSREELPDGKSITLLRMVSYDNSEDENDKSKK